MIDPAHRRAEDREFLAMTRGFAATGGLLEGDALVQRIAAREVIGFAWQSRLLVPAFQFEPGTRAVPAPVGRVIAELADVFDGWRLALWFARPNTWLERRVPADLVGREPAVVHDAARADRFIALG